MTNYAFNPLTGRLDRTGSGDNPPGGDITIEAGDGNSLIDTSFIIDGEDYKTVEVVSTLIESGEFKIENRTWITPYVVDSSVTPGERGTYATIQDAINAAVANGDATFTQFGTIILRNTTINPGYTENISVPAVKLHIRGNVDVTNAATTITGLVTVAAGGYLLLENLTIINGVSNCFSNSGDIALIRCQCAVTGNNIGNAGISAKDSSLQSLNITAGFFTIVDCNLNSPANGILNNVQFSMKDCVGSNSTNKISLNGTSHGEIINCTGMVLDGSTNGLIYIDSLSIFSTMNLPSAILAYNDIRLSPQSSATSFFTSTDANTRKKAHESGNTFKRRASTLSTDTITYIDQYVALNCVTASSLTFVSTLVCKQQTWYICDELGNAAANPKTIIAGSGKTINGATSIVINENYGWAIITYDGTNYFAMGSMTSSKLDDTPNGVFADGSDGSLTFDGTTTLLGIVPVANVYTLTRDIYLSSSNINSGVTIKSAGMRIFCNGTLTNNGLIDDSGNNGAAIGTAGAVLSGGSINGANTNSARGLIGGTGNTGAGGAGLAQAASVNTQGGAGGAGGAGGSAGGAAGVPTISTALTSLRFLPNALLASLTNGIGTVFRSTGGTGGGGGGGDGAVAGGGGGGGAGIIIIASMFFDGTGTIRARGGNGGSPTSGTNTGGGGSGGGGLVILISRSVISSAIVGQTVTVSAGTVGTGFGTGSAGTAGASGTAIYLPS